MPLSKNSSSLRLVLSQVFKDERVVIDGCEFRNCTFENVTLVYNGGSYGIRDATIKSIVLTSDHPHLIGLINLIGGLSAPTHQNVPLLGVGMYNVTNGAIQGITTDFVEISRSTNVTIEGNYVRPKK